MTVLTTLQKAAYQLGIPAAPASLTTATIASTLQLLNLYYSVGEELRSRKYWPQLKKVYTFSSTANRTKYPLPEDFYAAIPGTNWDATNKWQMVGPLWDSQMSYRRYGYATSENRIAFQIFGPDMNPNTAGGQFFVDPAPPSTISMTYNYITKSWLMPPNWTPSTAGITVNAYRNSNGNIYKCTAITTGTTGTTPPSVTTGTEVDGGVTWTYQTAPYEAVLSDSDICLFDEPLMILGLKAYYAFSKGVDNSEFQEQFERASDTAFARYNPVGKISLANGDVFLAGLNPNVPEGSYG